MDATRGTDGYAFICYVREDVEQVDELEEVLRQAGTAVWRDTSNLRPGQNWPVEIRRAIEGNAIVFLACFSRNTGLRPSFQNEELNLAVAQMRRREPGVPWFIPVRFDECEIPDWQVGGGQRLSDIHRADLFGEARGQNMHRLVEVIEQALLRKVEAAPLPEPLRLMVESANPQVLEQAVSGLSELLDGGDQGLSLAAREALDDISYRGFPRLAALARAARTAPHGQAVLQVSQLIRDLDSSAPARKPLLGRGAPKRRKVAIAICAGLIAVGLATAIPVVASENDAPSTAIRWSTFTKGQVISSAVVADGVVFIGSDDYELYALSTESGHILWSRPTEGILTSRPTVSGGVVYVGSGDDKVYALNAATGGIVWSHATGGPVGSSPAVSGGVVYVGSDDGRVYALNAANGGIVWTHLTGGQVESSPAVSGGVVYVGSGDGRVYALNAASGRVLWARPAGGHILSSPAVARGVVYIGSGDDRVYALNAASGGIVWSYLTQGSVLSSPAVHADMVYIGSGDDQVYALNAGP